MRYRVIAFHWAAALALPLVAAVASPGCTSSEAPDSTPSTVPEGGGGGGRSVSVAVSGSGGSSAAAAPGGSGGHSAVSSTAVDGGSATAAGNGGSHDAGSGASADAAITGIECGDVTCAANMVCCDHCRSLCISNLSGAQCPDDITGERECPDAGACSARLAGCSERSCCPGLVCCTGLPYPPQGRCEPACTMDSDVNLKTELRSVDSEALLDAVTTLPIARFRYRTEPAGVEHIGPMAQDFAATFQVGRDDRHIALVDASGVALAAVQALSRRVKLLEELQTQVTARNAELARALLSCDQELQSNDSTSH